MIINICRRKSIIKLNFKIINENKNILGKIVLDLKQHLTGLSGPDSNKKAGLLCPFTVEELLDAA